MPNLDRFAPSINPAGPAPTMQTWVCDGTSGMLLRRVMRSTQFAPMTPSVVSTLPSWLRVFSELVSSIPGAMVAHHARGLGSGGGRVNRRQESVPQGRPAIPGPGDRDARRDITTVDPANESSPRPRAELQMVVQALVSLVQLESRDRLDASGQAPRRDGSSSQNAQNGTIASAQVREDQAARLRMVYDDRRGIWHLDRWETGSQGRPRSMGRQS